MLLKVLLLLSFLPAFLSANRNVSISVPNPAIFFDNTFSNDKQPCQTYWTDKVGGTASFTFKGSGVFLYGTTSSYGGKFNVYLDGVEMLTVDRYSASSSISCDQLLWSATGFNDSTHSLRMVFAGKSDLSQDPGYFDVQKLMYSTRDGPTGTTSNVPPSSTGSSRSQTDTGSGSSSVGTIVGAVIGTFLGVALLGLGIFLYRRRRWQKVIPAVGDAATLDMTSTPHHTSPAGPITLPRPYSTEPFIWQRERQHTNHRPHERKQSSGPTAPSPPERPSYDFPVVPLEHAERKSDKYRARRRSEERSRRLSGQGGTHTSDPTSAGGDTSSLNRDSVLSGDPSSMWSDQGQSAGGAVLSEPDVARIAQAVLVGLQSQGPSGTGAHNDSSIPPPAYH